jgi:hypothetical protein
MATKIDPRSQPRGSADETGEVTVALLREQFQRSFVPRMSEDGAETPMVSPMVTPQVTPRTGERRLTNAPMIIPSITEARIAGKEMKITGSRSSRIAFKIALSPLKRDGGGFALSNV